MQLTPACEATTEETAGSSWPWPWPLPPAPGPALRLSVPPRSWLIACSGGGAERTRDEWLCALQDAVEYAQGGVFAEQLANLGRRHFL